jgi:hypothetical protein
MSAKKREVIWGGRIMAADMRAQATREPAQKAVKEADRAKAGTIRPQPGWPFAFAYILAEGVGFEPTVPLRARRFSRPVP